MDIQCVVIECKCCACIYLLEFGSGCDMDGGGACQHFIFCPAPGVGCGIFFSMVDEFLSVAYFAIGIISDAVEVSVGIDVMNDILIGRDPFDGCRHVPERPD